MAEGNGLMNQLRILDERQFLSELSNAIHDSEYFEDFLEDEVLELTQFRIIDMKNNITSQLTGFDGEDFEWRRRAVNKLRRIDSRLAQVKAVKNGPTSYVAREKRKWSAFAAEIAQALDDSDSGFMLDDIYLGDMSARRFLEIYTEKQLTGIGWR